MPKEAQLDVEKTFEDQKDHVTKNIMPTLMKTLDLVTYPIGEGVGLRSVLVNTEPNRSVSIIDR